MSQATQTRRGRREEEVDRITSYNVCYTKLLRKTKNRNGFFQAA